MSEAPTPSARDGRAPLLSGLIAATFTPMKADGDVDLEAIPAVTDYVLGQGASGLFVCGSTGESPSLTVDERRAVAAAYIAARDGRPGGDRAPVVVQVGHNVLREAAALASHAESIGADAIGLVPPSYFPPPTLDGLVASLKTIAEAAPSTPLYYYHIPRLSGVSTRMHDLLQRAEHELPTLAGIKFSSFELDDLLRCVDFAGGRYNLLFGSDEMLLAGLAMGVDGAVGSTYNFLGPHYRAVIQAHDAGRMDEARAHQLRATTLVHTILEFGGGAAIKAAMAILGQDCGSPRLPLEALSPQAKGALAARLEEETRRMEAAEA